MKGYNKEKANNKSDKPFFNEIAVSNEASREEKVEKRRAFIINTLYITIIVAIVYLIFKFAVPWILPFIIGFIISIILTIPIKLITKHTRIPRKFASVAVLVLGYGIIVAIATLLGFKIVVSLSSLFAGLPEFYNHAIKPSIFALNEKLTELVQRFSPDFVEGSDSLLVNISNELQAYTASFSSKAVAYIGSLTKQLPLFFIAFLFSIMFSVLITMHLDEVMTFIKKQIPQKHEKLLHSIKSNGSGAVSKYFRAYAIILSITFVELAIGLTILGVKNSILIAFGIALFDIFPFLGTGGIVLPWAIFSLVNGNAYLGIGLIIVYAIITVVRNIIEPRIVGDQLGLNPIIALICMYLGLRTMGLFGMIIVPIIAQVVISLNDEGLIRLWKK